MWAETVEIEAAEERAPRADEAPCAVVNALAELAELEYRLGDWRAAHVTSTQALRAARSARLEHETASELARLALLEAGLGEEHACRGHAARALELSRRHGKPCVQAIAGAAIGRLELGLGRIDSAIERLEEVAEICSRDPRARAAATTWPEDLADAYLRRGDPVGARRAVGELDDLARRTGSCVLVAALTRSRAMLAPENRFEEAFQRALGWAARAHQPFDLARTQLGFGERLRRAGRTREARERLAAALRTFEELGSAPWAGRARRELAAIEVGDRAGLRPGPARTRTAPRPPALRP